jgi:hypothetical protein
MRKVKLGWYVWMLRSEREKSTPRPRFKKRTWGTLRVTLVCECKKTLRLTVNCPGHPPPLEFKGAAPGTPMERFRRRISPRRRASHSQ